MTGFWLLVAVVLVVVGIVLLFALKKRRWIGFIAIFAAAVPIWLADLPDVVPDGSQTKTYTRESSETFDLVDLGTLVEMETSGGIGVREYVQFSYRDGDDIELVSAKPESVTLKVAPEGRPQTVKVTTAQKVVLLTYSSGRTEENIFSESFTYEVSIHVGSP